MNKPTIVALLVCSMFLVLGLALGFGFGYFFKSMEPVTQATPTTITTELEELEWREPQSLEPLNYVEF